MGVTTAKHTPGPWEVRPNYNSPRNAIMCGGQRIAVIGETSLRDGDPEANAHLIAAAPDLLDVTIESVTSEYWIDNASDLDCRMRLGYISESALAAIDKAEGESRC